jgi:hypothetical protein
VSQSLRSSLTSFSKYEATRKYAGLTLEKRINAIQHSLSEQSMIRVKNDRHGPRDVRYGSRLCEKLKNSKRDENDILGFDFKIEWACGLGG